MTVAVGFWYGEISTAFLPRLAINFFLWLMFSWLGNKAQSWVTRRRESRKSRIIVTEITRHG